jgi:serine phosphatase RsbU (regulator of sigma subunit)
MARLCSEVRYQLAIAESPRQAVQQLNAEFSRPENDTWFVTFVLCVLDPERHTCSIFNAGHMAPLCRRAETGVVEELGDLVAGPPLGCDPAIEYDFCTVDIEPGDSVLVYTDGISEAMNPKRELYGHPRLLEAVRGGPTRLDDLGQALLDDAKRFVENYRQTDDICLIGFQREP